MPKADEDADSFADSPTDHQIVEDEYEGPELVARRMRLILPEGPNKVMWDWFIIFPRGLQCGPRAV